RRFDVGTAKPTADERSRVPHFGIDVLDPDERYSAARWAGDAHQWLEKAAADATPVVVGGTGFYLRALFSPLFQEPALDPVRRALLQQELADVPVRELRRWCAELDPVRAHLGRSQLLRAIEIAVLTGERMSELHARAGHTSRDADGQK